MIIVSPNAHERPWLRRFSKLVVLATLCLIFLGGQVKSHDAGLAVPDWPTTYGENMFLFHPDNWVGNIFHEHVHRLVASGVGFLCIMLAAWLMFAESRRWVRNLGYAALAAVILQGLLGGLTVYFHLPASVSIAHAVLAQSFFIVTIVIAYSLSAERKHRDKDERTVSSYPLAVPALWVLGFVFVQLVLGALMRHTESGLAIPDFPAMGGQYFPWFTAETVAAINTQRETIGFVNNQALEPVTLDQVWIHFLHRLGALFVAGAVCMAAGVAWLRRSEEPRLWGTARSLMVLVVFQAGLGIYTVLSHKTPTITSLHVATGALVLGYSALFALRALPLQLHSPMRVAKRADWSASPDLAVRETLQTQKN